MIRVGWGRSLPAFRRVLTTHFVPGGTPEQMEWFDELQRVTTDPDTAVRIRHARNHDEVCQVTEPHGVLSSTYIYWSSFAGDGKLVRGRWVHPVTGGTLAFDGARGVIDMLDTPVDYSVRTTYDGRVVLPSTPQAPARSVTG